MYMEQREQNYINTQFNNKDKNVLKDQYIQCTANLQQILTVIRIHKKEMSRNFVTSINHTIVYGIIMTFQEINFLQFNRKNYNIVTQSSCQILSLNSNFDEKQSLETIQFEGSQLLEVDQYQNKLRINEKIQQISKISVLLLCINNGEAIKNIISKINDQQQRAIIYFHFKENCKVFDKVLICQKFQLEFFKLYLNQNGRSIYYCFDKAKENTRNFIKKEYGFKKEMNWEFNNMFGDVPSLFSTTDSFINQPFFWDEKESPQEITPLINHTNILDQINMDKIILKSKDIYEIKNFFNQPEVRLVNLHSTSRRAGKKTLALSFAKALLERNLHFTGGIHYIQKHSNFNLQNQQNPILSQSLQFSLSMNTPTNVLSMSDNCFPLQQSFSSISNLNNTTNHTHSNQNLLDTLKNLEPSLFKNRGDNNKNSMGNQPNVRQFNSQHQIHDYPVLIILKGFDFDFNKFVELFQNKDFRNYKFLNISKHKFTPKSQNQFLKNHEVRQYDQLLKLLIANNKKDEEEELINQKKGELHHQTSKNNKTTKTKQKNGNQKHTNGGNQNQGQKFIQNSNLNNESNKQNGIKDELYQIIPKTTPYLILKTQKPQKDQNYFCKDNNNSLTQQYNNNGFTINKNMNSSNTNLLKEQNDKSEFNKIDKDLFKSNLLQTSNSIQQIHFSQLSSKEIKSFSSESQDSQQFDEFQDNMSEVKQNSQQQYDGAIDSRNFDDLDINKNKYLNSYQSETQNVVDQLASEYLIKLDSNKLEILNKSQMIKGIIKPKYSSSNENVTRNVGTSHQQNNYFEINTSQSIQEDIELPHTDD